MINYIDFIGKRERNLKKVVFSSSWVLEPSKSYTFIVFIHKIDFILIDRERLRVQ